MAALSPLSIMLSGKLCAGSMLSASSRGLFCFGVAYFVAGCVVHLQACLCGFHSTGFLCAWVGGGGSGAFFAFFSAYPPTMISSPGHSPNSPAPVLLAVAACSSVARGRSDVADQDARRALKSVLQRTAQPRRAPDDAVASRPHVTPAVGPRAEAVAGAVAGAVEFTDSDGDAVRFFLDQSELPASLSLVLFTCLAHAPRFSCTLLHNNTI